MKSSTIIIVIVCVVSNVEIRAQLSNELNNLQKTLTSLHQQLVYVDPDTKELAEIECKLQMLQQKLEQCKQSPRDHIDFTNLMERFERLARKTLAPEMAEAKILIYYAHNLEYQMYCMIKYEFSHDIFKKSQMESYRRLFTNYTQLLSQFAQHVPEYQRQNADKRSGLLEWLRIINKKLNPYDSH